MCIRDRLSKIPLPLSQRHGYNKIESHVPRVQSNREVQVGENSFLVGECKGAGAYGKVFKAMKRDSEDSFNSTIADMDVVLKIQKPACEWEFYIGTEIYQRLRNEEEASRRFFMSIPRCFTFNDGSILVSEHMQVSRLTHSLVIDFPRPPPFFFKPNPFLPVQGTLLDIVNSMSSLKKTLFESVAIYFLIEMLMIAEKLQQVQIIHGDIKPDNFLLQRM